MTYLSSDNDRPLSRAMRQRLLTPRGRPIASHNTRQRPKRRHSLLCNVVSPPSLPDIIRDGTSTSSNTFSRPLDVGEPRNVNEPSSSHSFSGTNDRFCHASYRPAHFEFSSPENVFLESGDPMELCEDDLPESMASSVIISRADLHKAMDEIIASASKQDREEDIDVDEPGIEFVRTRTLNPFSKDWIAQSQTAIPKRKSYECKACGPWPQNCYTFDAAPQQRPVFRRSAST
jgi:hypothetical protein